MNKSKRLKKVKSLVKLREQMILVEFKEMQAQSDELKNQIKTLSGYKNESELIKNTKYINQLTMAKVFDQKIEQVVEALQVDQQRAEENLAEVGQKMKEVKTTLLSVSRLVERYRVIELHSAEFADQKQTEENLNYTQALNN